MAQTSHVSARTAPRWPHPVTLVRVCIILAVLVIWQGLALSGWLYRDVVPRLEVIAAALWKLLSTPDYYWNLWATTTEVALSLVIGGISGLAVGLLLEDVVGLEHAQPVEQHAHLTRQRQRRHDRLGELVPVPRHRVGLAGIF